jgi:CHAT domain-containing protein
MYRRGPGSCLLLVVLLSLCFRAVAQDKTADQLASRLIAAKNEAERNALLENEKRSQTPELVQAVLKQGWSLRAKGQMDQAESAFRIAREVADRIQDQIGVCDALLNIGIVHDIKGEHSEAISYFAQSLSVAERLNDKSRIARSLMDTGIAYGGIGDWNQQLDFYSRAQTVAESIPDSELIAKTSSNLGELYRVTGNYEKSIEHFQKAVNAFESGKTVEGRGKDTSGLAKALRGIGVVYLARGNYSLAMSYFQKSLGALGQSEDRSFLLVLFNDLGQVYEFQGDYAHALVYYRKGLALSEKRDAQQNMAQFFQDIGIVEEATGQYKAASSDLHKSLALNDKANCQECAGSLWMNLGEIAEAQGHLQEAIDDWQKGMTISEHAGVPQNVGDAAATIAMLYVKQGNYEQALAFSQRAITAAAQLNTKETLWKAKQSAGLAFRGLGKNEQAKAAFEEAVSIIEQLRTQVAGGEEQQQSFFSERLAPYRDMVELLVSQNQIADALVYAERAKGRSLLDVLQSSRSNVTKSMTQEEREKEQKLESEMVSLNKQMESETGKETPDPARMNDLKTRIETSRLQYAELQTNLYAAHPELRIQRGQVQPISLQESATLLPDPKSALLEYITGEEKTYLFVLTRKEGSDAAVPELKVYVIPVTERQLKRRAEHFREQLGQRDLAFRPTSRDLFRTLIGPAKSQLAGKTALVIVPDGPLWNLPFQALLGNEGRYLLQDNAIAYAPSLTVLREMMRVHHKNSRGTVTPQSHTLLAMADPVLGRDTLQRASISYRGENFGPLPEAKREAIDLKQLYGSDQSKVYTGSDAGEDRFKAEAGQYRVLHLATHGVFNDASPMYSYLLLSSGNKNSKEDGLLEAWEISQMDLKADLAVLSACETGRGRVSAGEGVIGLTWAFFVAGVPTTVVSQWKVESASTANLMLAFHQALRSDDHSGVSAFAIARALQSAELQLLRTQKYAHPFYWAGFIVLGDPQ